MFKHSFQAGADLSKQIPDGTPHCFIHLSCAFLDLYTNKVLRPMVANLTYASQLKHLSMFFIRFSLVLLYECSGVYSIFWTDQSTAVILRKNIMDNFNCEAAAGAWCKRIVVVASFKVGLCQHLDILMILFTLVLIVNLWKAGLEGFDHLRTKVDQNSARPSALKAGILHHFLFYLCWMRPDMKNLYHN